MKTGGKKADYLLFIDDLEVFARNKDQIDSLVNTLRIFSEYIKMEFWFSKYGVLNMKIRKVIRKGIGMPHGKMINNI